MTFDPHCTQYTCHLDIVKDGIGLLDEHYDICYVSMHIDVFNLVEIYVKIDGIPVIFDSGCKIAVAPYATGIVNKINPINKFMNRTGATDKVFGEGMINWNFRDDYGVLQRIEVKAYHVHKVRSFSIQ